MPRPIAVLRPEPGNAATARRLVALGYHVLSLPLFAVRPVAWSPPDPAGYDALLLTSANAVRHGGAGLAALTGLPVHAVGEATADAARSAGFAVVAVGDAGVMAMRPPGRVLQLVGREHRAFAGADAIMVYASEALYPDLGALAGGVALVHSPRAGRALADRVARRSGIAIAAISRAAALAAGEGWRTVAVADRPTDTDVITAAIALAD
jgi:uroporphyrinogen-III synthase